MIYLGLDDTDTLTSPGTGRLAREIAAALAATYPLAGVTRHQLLLDPRVPYTAKNSSAAILLDLRLAPGEAPAILRTIGQRVTGLLADNFRPGSDPGVAVAAAVPPAVRAFGCRAQRELLTQGEARGLAADHALFLQGVGGTEDGIIGALAAVGLAAGGDDGRYIQVGRARELAGPVTVDQVRAAGIAAVCTLAGQPVAAGTILAEKLRPARRGSRPVLFVEPAGPHWRPLKLD